MQQQLLRISPILLFFFAVACNSVEKKVINEAYINEINSQRIIKDLEFSDSLSSPLKASDIATFEGLNYFTIDEDYLVSAVFSLDTSMPVFKMATTTSRLPNYRVYGFVDFKLKDTLCHLAVFQNVDYKDDPAYGNTLFIPFRDATNGKQTYEAGRYFDILIPESDSVLLDFNTAYNPYCAYNKRWSCPLVPSENWLEIAILAGEKKFK
ncbi:MAG TPA: DUF1684 domain-containing protein [Bacteroidales bacterium]